MSTTERSHREHSAPMSDEPSGDHAKRLRGEAIKRRRLALDIPNVSKFAKATGRDWETVDNAEKGIAPDTTMEWFEAWLDREEAARSGAADLDVEGQAATSGPIRLTLHGVYGVDEIIVEGPVDHPDELAEAVGKILERLSRRED